MEDPASVAPVKRRQRSRTLNASRATVAIGNHADSSHEGPIVCLSDWRKMETPAFMPKDIETDVDGPDFIEFAKDHFHRVKIRTWFNKVKVPVEEIVTFHTEPFKQPLCKNVNKKTQCKLAALIYKSILKYTKVRPSKSAAGTAESLVEIVQHSPELINEVYAILVIQMTNAPQESLVRALTLFLIMSTIFYPNPKLSPYLLAFIGKLALWNGAEFAEMAQLCYIRLKARIQSGKSMLDEKINDKLIKNIPKQLNEHPLQFGASIYEIMWIQHRTQPKLPIPKILHLMCESLFQKNAQNVEGIFRLPGNLTNVQKLIQNANDGKEYIEGTTIHDMGSFLKQWFRDIPGALLTNEELGRVISTKGSEAHIEIAESLPEPIKNVLKYLCGFLRKLAESKDVTKMDNANLAMVFGPNIIIMSDNVQDTPKITSSSQQFLTSLINDWDVSSIYPLDESVLE